jgi:hypothetical protein
MRQVPATIERFHCVHRLPLAGLQFREKHCGKGQRESAANGVFCRRELDAFIYDGTVLDYLSSQNEHCGQLVRYDRLWTRFQPQLQIPRYVQQAIA